MNDKDSFILRNYQQEIVSRVHEAWMCHRSVMVQMPTGTGKTHVLAEIVKSYELQTTSYELQATCNELRATSNSGVPNGSLAVRSSSFAAKNILIVAHRVELIAQIKETLLKLKIRNEQLKVRSEQLKVRDEELKTENEELKIKGDDSIVRNEDVRVNKAESGVKSEKLKNRSADVGADRVNIGGNIIRVESIQTIARRIDALDFVPDLVVIDEAHHALAKTYRILWDKWQDAKFLGLTATPCRMNREGFTELFDTMISSWSIAEFIRQRVLSPFDYFSIRPGSAEQRIIDSLEKRGADGDYQVKEMDAVLNRRPSIERLYRSLMQFAKGKKGIVYAITIAHARSIADYYSRQGVKSVAIDSKTPREERKRLVDDFREGRIQVLVNVDVFSEGFDCPDVEFVQMARPTLSLAKYLQQVGRGLRMSDGKECCVLIDNVGLYRTFGLPVAQWDWVRMFRGDLSGKGVREVQQIAQSVYSSCLISEAPEKDAGIGLVISHETLLSKLTELDKTPIVEQKCAELRAWQDDESGLWGLKRGREIINKAVYSNVFGTRGSLAAVRFMNHECGLVDDAGRTIWKSNHCLSMRFGRNDFLVVRTDGEQELFLDLRNLRCYRTQPEIRRYGRYELLKVGDTCYSRTKSCYSSKVGYNGLYITVNPFFLVIHESIEDIFCLLENDDESYYRLRRWLADGTLIVSDEEGRWYHTCNGGEKEYMGDSSDGEELNEKINALECEVRLLTDKNKEERRNRIREDYRDAIPYQAGSKWGLKVGNRITVPPIYRNIQPPIGKYCAVEKHYCQWGIIAIDGTILIEPKYRKVSIETDGTVLLTQVTGKEMLVKLEE